MKDIYIGKVEAVCWIMFTSSVCVGVVCASIAILKFAKVF